MNINIKCEFSDYDTADYAAGALRTFVPEDTKILIRRPYIQQDREEERETFPVTPRDGAFPTPFSAISVIESGVYDNETEEKKQCYMEIDLTDETLRSRTISALVSRGGINIQTTNLKNR